MRGDIWSHIGGRHRLNYRQYPLFIIQQNNLSEVLRKNLKFAFYYNCGKDLPINSHIFNHKGVLGFWGAIINGF
jgi:hypothetical protein